MAENSKIEWCDHTFTPWIGCTKVSQGCANCYAESMMDMRFGKVNWGKGQLRKRTSKANWRVPLKWNLELQKINDANPGMKPMRQRVFCGSLCDVFDPDIPTEWRADLLDLIRRTSNLDWLLLTKRPENVWRLIFDCYTPEIKDDYDYLLWLSDWLLAFDEARGEPLEDFRRGKQPPENIWIGTSVEDQKRADERIPELLKIPAKVRFLSCEPLLWRIQFKDVPGFNRLTSENLEAIRRLWVICGGESGPNARPMHPDWARSLRDQCVTAGVPFFFKQWGEWTPVNPHITINNKPCQNHMIKVGKNKAGRSIDGKEWNEFPEV